MFAGTGGTSTLAANSAENQFMPTGTGAENTSDDRPLRDFQATHPHFDSQLAGHQLSELAGQPAGCCPVALPFRNSASAAPSGSKEDWFGM